MEPPNLLNWEFDVDIEQTTQFLKCLREMNKLAKNAILILSHFQMIRIFTPVVHNNHYSCAVLDIDSDYVIAPSNLDNHHICFDLGTWIRALRVPIFVDPGASLSISKSRGSMQLFGLFGVNRQQIMLGEAKFAQIHSLDKLNLNLPRCVEITMTSNQFTEFVQSLKNTYDDGVSALEMQTSTTLMRCVTPEYVNNDIAPETYFQFRLSWNVPLFEMFCSAATTSDSVELSVMLSSLGEKLYMFRFLRQDAGENFYYVVKEPHPDTHLPYGV